MYASHSCKKINLSLLSNLMIPCYSFTMHNLFGILYCIIILLDNTVHFFLAYSMSSSSLFLAIYDLTKLYGHVHVPKIIYSAVLILRLLAKVGKTKQKVLMKKQMSDTRVTWAFFKKNFAPYFYSRHVQYCTMILCARSEGRSSWASSRECKQKRDRKRPDRQSSIRCRSNWC